MRNHTVTLPRQELEVLEAKAYFADAISGGLSYSDGSVAVIHLDKAVLLKYLNNAHPAIRDVEVHLV